MRDRGSLYVGLFVCLIIVGDFTLYSDCGRHAARALGVAFEPDPEKAARHRGALVENTGHGLAQLLVPAVFPVEKEGEIRCVFFQSGLQDSALD